MDMIHKDLERKNAQIAAFKQDIEQEAGAGGDDGAETPEDDEYRRE